MKVLTWNVKGASSHSATWEFLEHEAPDIALLQEVTKLPDWILDSYNHHQVYPRFFDGHHAKFSTAILSKWPLQTSSFLNSSLDWVNDIHQARAGWIVECETNPEDAKRIRLVSVHSPAFPIPKDTYKGIEISTIQLVNNPDLWFTEILWSLLCNEAIDDGVPWIVGGDFNTSVLFDEPKDRGNRMVIARLNKLGLTDCLSHFEGEPVPTFKPSRGSVIHQLDYCYVNKPLMKRFVRAQVPDQSEIFDHQPKMLSDHLPIICEFRGVLNILQSKFLSDCEQFHQKIASLPPNAN